MVVGGRPTKGKGSWDSSSNRSVRRGSWKKKKISNGRLCIVNDVAMTAIGKRCDAGLMMGTRQPIHRDSAIKLL